MSAPLWLAVKASGGMQVHHLVVLCGQIVACLLQVCNLHEVAACKCLADVGVVIFGAEISAGQLYAHPGSYTYLHVNS